MFHTHALVEKVCKSYHLHNYKVYVNILFDYINQMDDQIKFTMEHSDKEGSIPLLYTKCTPHPSQYILGFKL